MRAFVMIGALALAGCATPPRPAAVPTASFESGRFADTIAACMRQSLPDTYRMTRPAPWHIVFSRAATSTAPSVQWDLIGNTVRYPTHVDPKELNIARRCAEVAPAS